MSFSWYNSHTLSQSITNSCTLLMEKTAINKNNQSAATDQEQSCLPGILSFSFLGVSDSLISRQLGFIHLKGKSTNFTRLSVLTGLLHM